MFCLSNFCFCFCFSLKGIRVSVEVNVWVLTCMTTEEDKSLNEENQRFNDEREVKEGWTDR